VPSPAQAGASRAVATGAVTLGAGHVQPVRLLAWFPLCGVCRTDNAPLLFCRPLLLLWLVNRQQPVGDVHVKRSQEEWKKRLTREAYHVLVERGTEMAGTSPLDKQKRAGTYLCAGCGSPAYRSEDKYNSGTGWPSFTLASNVKLTLQPLYCIGDFGAREVRCSTCGGHHGHVFSDGPAPTGKRYCINGAALTFEPAPGAADDAPEAAQQDADDT
jgi:peptide-methionine (R)-S-oxide reductase